MGDERDQVQRVQQVRQVQQVQGRNNGPTLAAQPL